MVILRKVKASTLMETLVATVLIIVIFLLSSLILNNMFSSKIKSQTGGVETRMNALHYLLINQKVDIPYAETFNQWNISISKHEDRGKTTVSLDAVREAPKKIINRTIYTHED